jgi:phytoene dehydrogenase-like protein
LVGRGPFGSIFWRSRRIATAGAWLTTDGTIFQGEILVQQMAFNRPVSGWSRYKTPIRDYWLASSSAHPGGGIMAAPGRLAALEILKSKRGEA